MVIHDDVVGVSPYVKEAVNHDGMVVVMASEDGNGPLGTVGLAMELAVVGPWS